MSATDKLYEAWSKVNDIASNPWTALVVIGFSSGWFAATILSHGKFDPGGQYGNYLQNAIQLVLLFVSASLAMKNASHIESIHGHINKENHVRQESDQA